MDRLRKIISKVGVDKVAHACLSTVIFLVSGGVMALLMPIALALVLSGFITIAIGFMKEVFDYCSYGKFDRKDFRADAVGVMVGVLISLLYVI